jgi:hypothetical protein
MKSEGLTRPARLVFVWFEDRGDRGFDAAAVGTPHDARGVAGGIIDRVCVFLSHDFKFDLISMSVGRVWDCFQSGMSWQKLRIFSLSCRILGVKR